MKLNITKLTNILIAIKNTFFRFPLAIIFAIISTCSVIYLIDFGEQHKYFNLITKIAFVSFFAISVFISCSLFLEKIKSKNLFKIASNSLLIILLIAYFFTLNEKIINYEIYRTLILSFAFHCILSFILFYKNTDNNLNFWTFNKIIFIRVLTSVIYSIVLYGGLSLAILGITHLFNVTFFSEIYVYLWFVIVGIFNTIFVLSGIPKINNENNEDIKYPTVLKIFSIYILIPLVTIYFTILYVYLFKILINWELPYGWVSYLVLFYSMSGYFALVLLYPIKDSIENKWLKLYYILFKWLLFPLLVLLFIAIITRINEYGITENRYYVFALAIWILIITIYFIINKFKNIKIIPISLSILAFLSVFGPWSSFNLSEKSQLNRLVNVMTENKLMDNNFFIKSTAKLDFNAQKDISSIIEYIVDNHGYKTLTPYFKQNLDSLCYDSVYCNRTYDILNLLGVEYVNRYYSEDNIANSYFYYTADNENSNVLTDINDFNFYYNLNAYLNNNDKDSIISVRAFNNDSLKLSILYNANIKQLIFNFSSNNELKINFNDYLQKLNKKFGKNSYKTPINEMIVSAKSQEYEVLLMISYISGNFDENNNVKLITNITGSVFIKYSNRQ